NRADRGRRARLWRRASLSDRRGCPPPGGRHTWGTGPEEYPRARPHRIADRLCAARSSLFFDLPVAGTRLIADQRLCLAHESARGDPVNPMFADIAALDRRQIRLSDLESLGQRVAGAIVLLELMASHRQYHASRNMLLVP